MTKNCLIGTLLAFMSLNAAATTETSFSNFQLSAYLGGTDSSIRQKSIYLVGETDSLISTSSNHQTDFTWGLGASYHHVPPDLLQHYNLFYDMSLGLDFFYFQTKQKGVVWQYQLPEMQNFNYSLPISSARFMVDTEWTFFPLGSLVYPFLEGGLGVAANTSFLNEVPVPNYDSPGLHIISNTNYQFAYTAGAGVKFMLPQHWNLSLRYLYANLGNTVTSSTANFPLVAPLTTGLSTQTWVLGLSYLF